VLPEPVLALLAAAFPGAQIADAAPAFGGFSNLTVVVSLDGLLCVVKAASHPPKRDDVRHEAAVLAQLRGQALPIPELLALLDGEGWTVAVTRRLPGAPGLRLYELPPAELPPVFRALGRTLARVHDITIAQVEACGGAAAPHDSQLTAHSSRSRTEHSVLSTQHSRLAELPLDEDLRAALTAALAHKAWRTADPRLVHGDAGLHNILWDGCVTGLLDWEWASWGSPLVDLAWVAWTMRFRQVPAECWEGFLAGYEEGGGAAVDLDAEALRALALGQIAAILVRSYGRPGAWEEWLRRARWTMGLSGTAARTPAPRPR
jgi:aminoglycoside phosphotransferase (APT) family kinase protein